MSLTISPIYAALLAILHIALAYRVTVVRRAQKVGVGDNGSHDILVAVRAHGNLIENAPFAIALLLMAELNGLSGMWLHILGAAFLIGRIGHAYGFAAGNGGVHFCRYWGTVFSWVVILALALVNLKQVVLG
ncbi:MAPEG family protein [Biformimicrobium ophioploci]|uniref:MAPEG family protein n=1 Tax=Biformimicrobium ophioploci TaxID=3036711 RepID=A0ABQ6M2D7_9GAMM|nr:MAPEG family protein [Microbulbifer sp. NKW57]GMG88432.1 MAPEG family protein [Microbulbifer sp. NKW57]